MNKDLDMKDVLKKALAVFDGKITCKPSMSVFLNPNGRLHAYYKDNNFAWFHMSNHEDLTFDSYAEMFESLVNSKHLMPLRIYDMGLLLKDSFNSKLKKPNPFYGCTSLEEVKMKAVLLA